MSELKREKSKESDVRMGNIIAAKAVADAVRTSLGPRGMDKMIQNQDGEVLITNDGATILDQMTVFHPTAKMLVGLSKSQDIEAGDGTTSVVVIAGSLLDSCQGLLDKGIHPTKITECFLQAEVKALEILRSVAIPVDLSDKASLVRTATTSLSSKVVYQNAGLLAPMAVDAVLKVSDIDNHTVDLKDIKVVEQLGGTIDDSLLVDGLCLKLHAAGSIKRVKNAKIGLAQFCLSPPKTDMENNVVLSEYSQMDRLLKAEKKLILGMCKKIKKAGCNVLLMQKSILRDATTALSRHYLSKMKIMVVTDVERSDIEFITRTLGCKPVADVDSFSKDKLGFAESCESVSLGRGSVVKITGVKNPGKTVSILLRGSNDLLLGEAGRSLHDALCVVRSLVKERFLIVGGGAPEMQLQVQLEKYAQTLPGINSHCIRAFAQALEIIPATLAENAGMHPVTIVTALRKLHNEGKTTAGINVKKGVVEELGEKVLQPLLVNTSAISLASECVRMIMKIDDMVTSIR